MDAPILTGYGLETFRDVLTRVTPEFDADPAASFDPWDEMDPWVRDYVLSMGHPADVPFMDVHTQIPSDAYQDVPFERMCMIHHSGSTYMADAVRKRREHNPRWAILHRIKASAWHWTPNSSDRIGWNDTVDAHASIRSFDIAVEDFETTLDWNLYAGARGTGIGSGVWLDGSFAYLVHHRGRHVMTLGFSITGDRRVLVQQIQNASRRGNRWLFSFPKNRVEHVIDRFRAAFPGFVVMLADGRDVACHSLTGYRAELRLQTTERRRHAAALQAGVGDLEHHRERHAKSSLHARAAAEKIVHIRAELPRLDAFYADSGRYRRGPIMNSKGFRHYEMAA